MTTDLEILQGTSLDLEGQISALTDRLYELETADLQESLTKYDTLVSQMERLGGEIEVLEELLHSGCEADLPAYVGAQERRLKEELVLLEGDSFIEWEKFVQKKLQEEVRERAAKETSIDDLMEQVRDIAGLNKSKAIIEYLMLRAEGDARSAIQECTKWSSNASETDPKLVLVCQNLTKQLKLRLKQDLQSTLQGLNEEMLAWDLETIRSELESLNSEDLLQCDWLYERCLEFAYLDEDIIPALIDLCTFLIEKTRAPSTHTLVGFIAFLRCSSLLQVGNAYRRGKLVPPNDLIKIITMRFDDQLPATQALLQEIQEDLK